MILINAFSANMIAEFPASVGFTEIGSAVARWELSGELHSAVGHADTAAVFAKVLGIPVPCNRETVTLHAGQLAILGQYSGPRLPEGATTLPEGARIKWLLVEVW